MSECLPVSHGPSTAWRWHGPSSQVGSVGGGGGAVDTIPTQSPGHLATWPPGGAGQSSEAPWRLQPRQSSINSQLMKWCGEKDYDTTTPG